MLGKIDMTNRARSQTAPGLALIGDAALAADPLFGLKAVIVKIAVDIQSQHKLHAAALVDAIEALNGTAVVEADVAKAFKPPKALTDAPTISNVLKFAASAERGAAVAYNQVIAGYYDAAPEKVADWLAAAQAVPGSVIGVMYTTWRHDYSQIEKFSEVIDRAVK